MMLYLFSAYQCGIIHGDVKPDNFVLFPSTADFPAKDLFLQIQRPNPLLRDIMDSPPVIIAGIDFGRSLDVHETLSDVVFVGK